MAEPRFDKMKGLIPVITQEAATGKVLMQAYINRAAWQKTLETGIAHYYSRSRQGLWKKGESSGNIQIIKNIRIDCDEDSVLYMVEQRGGAACHKGYTSCYYREVYPGKETRIVEEKVFNPEERYSS